LISPWSPAKQPNPESAIIPPVDWRMKRVLREDAIWILACGISENWDNIVWSAIIVSLLGVDVAWGVLLAVGVSDGLGVTVGVLLVVGVGPMAVVCITVGVDVLVGVFVVVGVLVPVGVKVAVGDGAPAPIVRRRSSMA
jgi:hypothetical protein